MPIFFAKKAQTQTVSTVGKAEQNTFFEKATYL